MSQEQDLGFSFQQRNGVCTIFHQGRKAAVLRGRKAGEFEAEFASLGFADQQLLMAKLTGNYKRGNERTAKNHPRNRR